ALRASDAERDAMITALRDAAAEGAWRVGDRPLVIERDPDPVQSDRLVMLHHEGDLLTGPRLPETVAFACSGGHSSFTPGRIPSRASVDRGLAESLLLLL
ncbi:MAG: DUF1707 domain-containing protein, partial [Actinomycetota bacterium]|nr:DUF1707 domain-containing protein [Actinomycetota bacterium]